MSSKKAKIAEGAPPPSTRALEDSDDEGRARSPSPSRRKTTAVTPSQEAAHADSKKSQVAMMVDATAMMQRQSAKRSVQGSAPAMSNNNSKYGEAQMTTFVIGYADSTTKHGKTFNGTPLDANKMSLSAVPISMGPRASFDLHGSNNPYMSGMIATHRPRNAGPNSRQSVQRKDGTSYNAAYPKCPTFIPNGEIFPGQEESLGFKGQISCVTNGGLRKMNRFALNTLQDTPSGKTSAPLPLPVGTLVTLTSITGEDTTRDGYNPKKGRGGKPDESTAECEKRVEDEHNRAMVDRKFALQFKNAEGKTVENKLTPGRIYKAPEIIDYLYNNAEFQENVTVGLMAAHTGWVLKEFEEQAHDEDELEQAKLEYDGAKMAATCLQSKRKTELNKTAAQLKRNVQEWQKSENNIYQSNEPGFKEKIELTTALANDLELAAADGDSRLKPWDMPYPASKYSTTLVFNSDNREYGRHTNCIIKGEETPKTFTDFTIQRVTPKSNGYGYMIHIHTMTVADRQLAIDQFAKGSTGALLDSRAFYSYNDVENGGFAPLVLSCNDGALSVAFKVQSIKHLPIVANMLATPYGNGIITSLFAPRAPDSVPDEKCYVDMIVPDVICKLQKVGLQVSAEWLKEKLCDKDDDDYSLEPVSLDKNNVDVSKSSAFANATASLMDDTFVNLHELTQGSVSFDKIANKETKTYMKEHNRHLEYRVLVPLDDEGALIDLTEGITKSSLDHMDTFGQMSMQDAQAFLEKAATVTKTDEGESYNMHDFLKKFTIPYAFMVTEQGTTV